MIRQGSYLDDTFIDAALLKSVCIIDQLQQKAIKLLK
jgi:hypothetical protein